MPWKFLMLIQLKQNTKGWLPELPIITGNKKNLNGSGIHPLKYCG